MARFTAHNRWFFQATAFICVVLIISQLFLTTVDANSNRRRNRHRGRNRNSRKMDSPNLQEGHSFARRKYNQLTTSPSAQVQQFQQNPTYQRQPPEETEEQEKEAKKNLRIERIKENILKQLNLGTPPNVSGIVQTSNPSVRKMIDDVDQSNKRSSQHSEYLQDVPVQMQNIFIPVEEDYPFDYRLPDNADVMYFKLNEGEINLAFLHFYIKPVPASIDKRIAIEISRIKPPVTPGGLVQYSTIVREVETVNADRGMWTKIPLYQQVSEWTKNPEKNLGIVVQMVDSDNNQFIVTNSTEIPSEAPLLEVRFTKEASASRPTRSLSDSRYPDSEIRCQRYPLPINFTEHSFDFVVAPKVYMANFCNGKCGYLYAQQAIHHSIVQKLQNSTATYGPCCGAKNLMSINMLYYDHDKKIRLDVINDMIIEQCSCD